MSVTLKCLYALVSNLCLTGLSEVVMPYSDMWQDCQITLQLTRPCYAKSSYRSVDPRPYMVTSTRSTTYQINRPTPPRQQQCSHCDSAEASHWSRSLESGATVQADYALTKTTTTTFNGLLSRTTRVSRHQKGKTSLDFTEARDSEWHWHQLGHMQVCISLQRDNHASTLTLIFLQVGCPSRCPTNSVKAH